MTNNSAALDRVFHALADPTRRAIVHGSAGVPPRSASSPSRLSMAAADRSATPPGPGIEPTDPVGKGRARAHLSLGAGGAFSTVEHWIGRQRIVWEQRLDRMEAYVKTLHARGAKHDE